MFSDIRRFVALDNAAHPTYMGFGIPMPPPEYQVLQNMPHLTMYIAMDDNKWLKFVNFDLEICAALRNRNAQHTSTSKLSTSKFVLRCATETAGAKKAPVFSGIINRSTTYSA